MKSVIDLRDESIGITVEPNLGTPGIKVTFDNASIDTVLKIGSDESLVLGNALLEANGEKTTSEWEYEVYKLEEENNNLKEIIEDYEERMEYMRRKEQYVPF